MRRSWARFAVAILAAGLVSRGAAAQAAAIPPVVGFDAGVTFNVGSGGYTQVSVPSQRIRAAFAMSDRVAFEPAASLSIFRGDDITVTTYDADFGLLFRGSSDSTRSRPYLRPSAGIVGFSSDRTKSSRFAFGIGVGIEVPADSRLALRYEASIRRQAGSELNIVGFSLGLSFKTR